MAGWQPIPRIMGRYKVKAERVAENGILIRVLFGQLAHNIPVSLRYAAFKQPDDQSFAHVL
jgi:hypothetical protein